MNKKQKNSLKIVALIVIAIIAYFSSQKKSSDISNTSLTAQDFIIEDTASIDRLVITDTYGGSIDLKKTQNGWISENQLVRNDAIKNIIKMAKDIRLHQPVDKRAQKNLIKIIMVTHKQIDFYVNGKKYKTYIVGEPTQSNLGTYMLLENHENGKTVRYNTPYIMGMKHFRGRLDARVFTDKHEWYSTKMFNYDVSQITEVKLKNIRSPKASFTIRLKNGKDIEVLDENNTLIENPNSVNARQYLTAYKKRHFVKYLPDMPVVLKDSILKNSHIYELTVTTNTGISKKVDMYEKPFDGTDKIDIVTGIEHTKDNDHCYLNIDNKLFVLGQYYVMDPLLITLSDLKK